MAGAGFTSNLEQMRTSAQHVFEVNEQVQSELSQLGSAIDALMSQWSGDAAVSFGNVRVRWDAEARKLNDALRSIGDTLVAGHADYSARQETQSQNFSQISSVLG